jgi:hypothetical protein
MSNHRYPRAPSSRQPGCRKVVSSASCTPALIARIQAGVRGRERTTAGSATTASVIAPTSSVGSTTRPKSWGPDAPAIRATPAPITVELLTALVRKNNPPERRTIQSVGTPARWISQPPMASPPAPPPGSSAPVACSVQARARASRPGRRSKNRRNRTTKLTSEASSSRTARPIQIGLSWPIRWATLRRPGTAARSVRPRAASSPSVASCPTTLDGLDRVDMASGAPDQCASAGAIPGSTWRALVPRSNSDPAMTAPMAKIAAAHANAVVSACTAAWAMSPWLTCAWAPVM